MVAFAAGQDVHYCQREVVRVVPWLSYVLHTTKLLDDNFGDLKESQALCMRPKPARDPRFSIVLTVLALILIGGHFEFDSSEPAGSRIRPCELPHHVKRSSRPGKEGPEI
ncbi:hypothetical protein P154DRAFT_259462 [Amniculicola lignicola CBS 123094]|uniref:Uncharacterized protein n=1 Tax=Amniculicola lignicola CBS 123094 TaxID=1392246 RepID=A0A6A5WZ44_9PLEO|nr:hypothetical protein P154DRAFT_259462 [Amniculicola lignicola CBS 123094]